MLVPRRHLAWFTGAQRCFHLSPGRSTIRGSGGQRDGPARSEKVRRLYQVPVAISNNKTVGNGGINKSAAAAASPVGRAVVAVVWRVKSAMDEPVKGSTTQRVNPEILPIVLEPAPDPTTVTLDGITSAVLPWSYVPGLM